VPPFLYV